jgi:hypothetical protein
MNQNEKRNHLPAALLVLAGILIVSSFVYRGSVIDSGEWTTGKELIALGLALAGGGAMVIGYLNHFRNL